MTKFTQGQVIKYNGGIYRVRLVAEVGFEGATKPFFYDLIEVTTKQQLTETIESVEDSATLHEVNNVK